MAKAEMAALKEILEQLRHLNPPIKKISVEPLDPALSFLLLDLSEVCYITTETPSKPVPAGTKKEDSGIMFVTSANEKFFSAMELGNVEEKLKDHPHFMRTSRFYIVNLTKIRGYKFSNARDLWFEGLKKPLKNGVTATHKDEFDAVMGIDSPS